MIMMIAAMLLVGEPYTLLVERLDGRSAQIRYMSRPACERARRVTPPDLIVIFNGTL